MRPNPILCRDCIVKKTRQLVTPKTHIATRHAATKACLSHLCWDRQSVTQPDMHEFTLSWPPAAWLWAAACTLGRCLSKVRQFRSHKATAHQLLIQWGTGHAIPAAAGAGSAQNPVRGVSLLLERFCLFSEASILTLTDRVNVKSPQNLWHADAKESVPNRWTAARHDTAGSMGRLVLRCRSNLWSSASACCTHHEHASLEHGKALDEGIAGVDV